ncbi:hypothetical protein COHA_002839 [Chlorella ohadii]|uniref:Uncharacterized protein n=1 Tax=Chlorella ohadii TaxID=2649997 RepID=A0AAD5DTX9_9CHLO|nr:hypothetical protein COHA_002839 [Chlorella ohadii]
MIGPFTGLVLSVLLLVGARYYTSGWVRWLADASILNEMGWQQLLEKTLLPVFNRLYASYNLPPQQAAAFAAQAAAVRSRGIPLEALVYAILALLCAYVAVFLNFLKSFALWVEAVIELRSGSRR